MMIFAVQNAPMTEQQQAAIVALSHAVAERPFPAKLVSPSARTYYYPVSLSH